MSTSSIQFDQWLQQLPQRIRSAADANGDGRVDTQEFVSFLSDLLDAARGQQTGGAPGKSRAPGLTAQTPVVPEPVLSKPALPEQAAPQATESRSWRDFVFGENPSGNYAGVMVPPSRTIAAGYTPGAFRHTLEGFNPAKFDPLHPEGMTLKMIAGRIFEQFDPYSPSAIDDVVAAFNSIGIPATKIGIDQIDFNNGEGPIDVMRNAGYLSGDLAAGLAWQWAPVNEGTTPKNFTSIGLTAPTPSIAPPASGEQPTRPGPVSSLNPYLPPDQVDLGQVTWLHGDVSRWPVTSRLTSVQIGADQITLEHSKAGLWPVMNYNGTAVEGNPWVLVNRNGQWYGATYEWLRPGQTSKGVTGGSIGANIKVEPLASWRPRPGELVGFMVSTPARDGSRTSNERSNVVLAPWPA